MNVVLVVVRGAAVTAAACLLVSLFSLQPVSVAGNHSAKTGNWLVGGAVVGVSIGLNLTPLEFPPAAPAYLLAA